MDFRKNDHGAAPHDISINFTPPQSFIPNPTLFCFCKYSPGNKLLWVSKTKRFSTWELLPVYNCHLISFQHIDGADLLTANKKSIRSLMLQQTLNSLTGRRCQVIFVHASHLLGKQPPHLFRSELWQVDLYCRRPSQDQRNL